MSITSQIIRIQTNIANAYDAAEAKGATLPAVENTENLASTIESITTGGGSSSSEEITAYNYTATELKQGDWVHYNERVDNTSQIGNYDINGYANGYCVAPNIILYSSGAYNPNTIFTATLNESDNTYVASQVGSVSGYARRFCGIDKDGYLYSNTAFSSLNYEEGLYWGNNYNSAYSEYYLANGYLYKINKLTGSNISSFVNISYVMHDVYGGYSISDNILVVAKDGTLTKVILNFDNNTLSKTPTALSCGSIFGGMSNGIIFGQVSKPSDTVTSALLAFKYENGALITYSKENFPSAMQECFDNACNPFWDEQHGIFTAYIPSMSKLVCCQYVNNKWIDKSPILDVSNLSINTQSQFMVSSDFSRAFLKDTTQYGILQFSITSASDGNYLVPYSYTNSNSKMGKVKENVDAAIGTQCTVVIPSVTVADPSTPDTPTIDPSALKFGDRIDNKATVVGTYNSNDGKTYVYAVLDAQYRGANIAWSTGLYDSDIDTGLPNYGSSASLSEQNHESATYNTNYILTNYSDKATEAFTYCRSIEPLNFNGETYNCQLPNAYELLQIFNKKTELDALDPTAEANSTKKLSNWGFGSNSEYVLTSNEFSKWFSWEMGPSGSYNNYSKRDDNRGVCPIIEIPINTGVEIDVSNSEYTYSDGNLVLTKYTGTSQDVTIPNPFYKG